MLFPLVFSPFAEAHEGGLNKFGCHNDKKKNYYHCHKDKKVENPKNVLENKNDINLKKENKKFEDKKNKKIKNLPKKRKIELQSYKIIFILKDVDPKDPTEELNSILSNSEVNFCLLYTSPSPRDISGSRMPSSA